MSDLDDMFLFNDEKLGSSTESITKPWRVLIVDDEQDIHSLTKMVLKGFSFEDRPLEINSVYSGIEAIEFLKKENDIAIILLDVVMETEDAGLRCVKVIREELLNSEARIILRTGQPGQAPEQQIIVDYDINDYKAKTELTASKLFTTIISSLRSYKYIQTINQSRIGLENIVSASRCLFEVQSFGLFAKGILEQLTSILSLDKDALYINSSSFSAFKESKEPQYNIFAGTGTFSEYENKLLKDIVSDEIQQKLTNAADRKESIFDDKTYTGYFNTQRGEHTLLYLQWQRPLTPVDKELIQIYSKNVAAAFENLSQNNDRSEAQREIVLTLSKLIENSGTTSPSNIKNIINTIRILAKKLQITADDIKNLILAAPLYDIGEISVPREILTKPTQLTPDELEIMRKHTTRGHEILDGATRGLMSISQIISYQHHEKWDGTGYPLGLKGEDIHIYSRIVALADVVEALSSRREYRDAWNKDDIINHVKSEKGKHFDPSIVDAFLGSVDEIMGSKGSIN